jgi:hypothetical protein
LGKKYTILFAFITMIAVVVAINQQALALAQNQTYESYYSDIRQYCLDRVEKILAGYNPVNDLVKANLIPRHFENMTCADVSNEALGNSASTFSKLEH